MPESTLRAWTREERWAGMLKLCEAKKGDMAAAFRDVVWVSLGAALGKLDEATYSQLMTGAGISFDKMRVLQGQSTVVTETRTVSVDATRFIDRLSDEQVAQLAGILEHALSGGPGGRTGSLPGEVGAADVLPVPAADVPGDGAEPDPGV